MGDHVAQPSRRPVSLDRHHRTPPLSVDTDDGYVDILDFVANLRTGLTSPDAIPGCLIVNDMAAGADPGAAARYRSLLEDGARAALARTDNLNDEQRSNRARLLTSSVIGVNLVSKATGDPDEIGRFIDALAELVKSWSQADRSAAPQSS